MQGKAGSEYDRDLPIAFLRYDRERWAVIYDGYKYILHTGSGEEELYNLATDFGETDNLANQLDTAPYAKALSEIFGVPAGHGWRVRVDLGGGEPITIKLPKAALGADILNPEALSPHRANQAWGEPPKRVPSDVGVVELADDKTGLTFTPGPQGNGVLWVQFDSKTVESPTVTRGSETLSFSKGNKDRLNWSGGANAIAIEPGMIIVPPVGEAARIKALRGDTSESSGDDLSLLKALGYVGEEGADGGQPDDGHGH